MRPKERMSGFDSLYLGKGKKDKIFFFIIFAFSLVQMGSSASQSALGWFWADIFGFGTFGYKNFTVGLLIIMPQ